MAMNKVAMKAKVAAAYNARTGKTMTEGTFNALIDICQGIIEEMLASAEVEVSVTVVGGSSAGVHSGTGIIKA